jgi:hypothetical protein
MCAVYAMGFLPLSMLGVNAAAMCSHQTDIVARVGSWIPAACVMAIIHLV